VAGEREKELGKKRRSEKPGVGWARNSSLGLLSFPLDHFLISPLQEGTRQQEGTGVFDCTRKVVEVCVKIYVTCTSTIDDRRWRVAQRAMRT